MEREEIKAMYEKYDLQPKDVFKHQHYIIITRSGIEKIQAKEGINIEYEVVRSEPNFASVKAKATIFKFLEESSSLIKEGECETFGSALYGKKKQDPETKKWIDTGTTGTWYVLEMAEKRAMSRAVLKITGLYEMGVFGQDESEDFKRS